MDTVPDEMWVLVGDERIIEKGSLGMGHPGQTIWFARDAAEAELNRALERYSDDRLPPHRAGEGERWNFRVMRCRVSSE